MVNGLMLHVLGQRMELVKVKVGAVITSQPLPILRLL